MPIYEYECAACGQPHEALQKVSDRPLKKCPDCGKPKLKRLLSAPMFLLKGSGWYETDFKSDKETKRNLADQPEKVDSKAEPATGLKTEDKAESKPETSADSKPEAKSETKAGTAKKRTAPRVQRGSRRTPNPG